MPSSSDLHRAAPTQAHPTDVAGSGRLGGVRPARLDRPLTGAESVGHGGTWGDPALDAALAAAMEDGRRRGTAQGYATGWAAGLHAAAERERVDAAARAQAADVERRERLGRAESLLAALAEARRQVAAAAAPTWEQLADVLADGALAIARAALARELSSVDDDVERRVRAALEALADDGRLAVHLHPDDVAALAGARLPEGTQLVPDVGVRPGTVDVRGDVRRLRIDIPAAVAAAEEVLRS
ncbi:MAG TPA: FliH/SctL family protein [Kineosporiaceae bacterium]|nr:FliH/SctL family protein [Kineosporiaceae bacterium]